MTRIEKIVDALISLIGYAGWSVADEVVTYYPDAQAQPTMQEIEAEILRREPIIAAEKARKDFIERRSQRVNEITVTVNGKTYDGNEVAQGRMDRAIRAAQILNSPVIPLWVLADNSVVTDIPVSEFEQALALSVVAMSEVWVDE